MAARAECSPRAAIRMRIIGRARGMFWPCRNGRADRWLRGRNALPALQYAPSSLTARKEYSPRATGPQPCHAGPLPLEAPGTFPRMCRRAFPGFPPSGVGEKPGKPRRTWGKPGKHHAGGFFGFSPLRTPPEREKPGKPSAEEEEPGKTSRREGNRRARSPA